MEKTYKIISYIFISGLLAFLISIGTGKYFEVFRSNSVALLTTILAVSISATSLVSGELSKLKRKYPNAKLSDVFGDLEWKIIIQIVMILLLLTTYIVKDILVKNECTILEWYTIANDAILIASLMFSLETIYDLGKGLMELLSFNQND